jgi:hypothetical protein
MKDKNFNDYYNYMVKSFPFEVERYFLHRLSTVYGINDLPSQCQQDIKTSLVKYLILSKLHRMKLPIDISYIHSNIQYDYTPRLVMPSAIIDELWHVFMLHNEAYNAYCMECLGDIIYHEPDIVNNDARKTFNSGNRSYSLNVVYTYYVISKFTKNTSNTSYLLFSMDNNYSDTKLVKEYGWIYDTTAINELKYISDLIFGVGRYSIITFYLDIDMNRNIKLKDTAKRLLSGSNSNNHPSASKLDTSKKISLDKNRDDDDDINLYNNYMTLYNSIDNSSFPSNNSHSNGSSHSIKSSSESNGSSCSSKSGGSSGGSSCGSSCGS